MNWDAATRKYRLGASSSSRARLIRRAIKPRSPAERWRRSDYLKDSVVTRKRWQVVPDSSTTSSRHSGLSLSLATVSRIMSEHAAAASSQAALSSGKSTRGVLE